MGSNLSQERQDQIANRYNTANLYSGIVFNSLNLITLSYAGYKTIRNPQRHLVILCSCFGSAALANAVQSVVLLTNSS